MSEHIIDKIISRKQSIKRKTKEINTRPLILLIAENESIDIINILKLHSVEVNEVSAYEEYAYKTFDKFIVRGLEEILLEYGCNINIFISTNINKNVCKVVERLLDNGVNFQNIYFGPTRESYCDLYDERKIIFDNSDKVQQAYDSFADAKSKLTYEKVLTRLISKYVFHYEYEKEDFKQYFSPQFLKCVEEEIFLDAGMRDGGTSKDFIEFVQGKYTKIYGFEADRNNYYDIITNLKDVRNVEVFNKALYCCKDQLKFMSSNKSRTPGSARISLDGDIMIPTIDGDSLNINPTFIKMDIEGSEMAALDGLRETIIRMKPKMAVCVYHSLTDFWEIPLKIKEINPEYNISLRNHENMYCLIETVCYAY